MSATITQASKVQGEDAIYQSNNGPLQRWAVTVVDDGEEIKTRILRKPDSPDPSGLDAEKDKNGRWKVASQGGGGGSGGGGKYEADSRGLRGKNASSALHAAIAATEGKEVTSDNIVALADKFYDFIEKQAKVDGPVGGS